MAKAKKKKQINSNISVDNHYFEIINWKKAQPRMKGSNNDWLKLYTSLLEHDGFGSLDDSARMLIIALWLYAARSGLHIFPADPAWLAKKIPILNSKPDLGPLLDAKDCYGEPTPFIRYCKSPKAKKGGKARSADTGGKGGSTRSKLKRGRTAGTGIATRTRARAGESRVEESRREEREEREETKPLRVSGETEKRKKERISKKAAQQTETQQIEALEPEKPENPIETEAGSAKRHFLLKPAHSAIRRHRNPQHIGTVLSEWLPDHWQDPDAESFGWEIVRALGYSDDLHNLKTRSEWGAFASWWSRVKKSVPMNMLDDLRAKAIRKADYLRTKGNSAKNPSAVWFHIMNGELRQRGVTMTQMARASPSR